MKDRPSPPQEAETPAAHHREQAAASEAPSEGEPTRLDEHAGDPPPPAGVVLPKIYGDAAPRPGPIERSSVWILVHANGPVRHEVRCDSLQHAGLREVLRELFSGAVPGANDTPPTDGNELLRIEWQENGKPIAVSKLLDNGVLVREQAGEVTVDRQHSPATLRRVSEAIQRAGLRSAGTRFCAGD